MAETENTNPDSNPDDVTQPEIPETGREDQAESVKDNERSETFPEEPDAEEAQADLDQAQAGEPTD
ncbi:hypothetical protein KRR55_19895 [Paeniglutamicibacter sp. ABSL32-1]|uniref:hypothetical protein n=1 Tax=Paeniglutamicibacter quisquiliarum TaxID=2849498 RepID=UPI001C2DC24D|nr:hypothetical protein [Paeniglutamicibacter quisquiliarum]MBV1781368.1 hypothetical protein [Paeniglutamicibacter quisquiliarum]